MSFRNNNQIQFGFLPKLLLKVSIFQPRSYEITDFSRLKLISITFFFWPAIHWRFCLIINLNIKAIVLLQMVSISYFTFYDSSVYTIRYPSLS